MKYTEEELQKFMKRAIELSEIGMDNNHGGPFGAVVVKNGEIVGEGYNLVTSSNDPTAHGEVTAIRNACKNLNTFDLSGCVLFTSCEPCPMCFSAIYWANIDEVFYGNDKHDARAAGFRDDFIYDELDKPADKRSKRMLQINREEAWQVFQKWIAKENKTMY